MTTILIMISISSMVLQNCLQNQICKKQLNTPGQVNHFNRVVYAVCILMFAGLLLGKGLSLYTLLLGLLFGLVTALCNLFKMMSLSCGPMHITLLITTSSMIIPTMSGVFFGETFSIGKLCIVVLLIGFIYISLDKTGDKKINGKWMLYCGLCFLLLGAIGILQKIHQSSVHRSEASGFLLIAFICSFVYSMIRGKGNKSEMLLSKKYIVIGAVCGFCTFAMNYINLKLSGMLPSQLFFPLVNGSAIVLSSVMSVVLFKEQLSKKQLAGLCGGIGSLIAICLVP